MLYPYPEGTRWLPFMALERPELWGDGVGMLIADDVGNTGLWGTFANVCVLLELTLRRSAWPGWFSEGVPLGPPAEYA